MFKTYSDKIASVLAKESIEVVFGDFPYPRSDINNKIIYMPNLQILLSNNRHIKFLDGIIDHEVSHILYSKDIKQELNEFEFYLFQLIEDARISVLFGNKYFGADSNLLHVLDESYNEKDQRFERWLRSVFYKKIAEKNFDTQLKINGKPEKELEQALKTKLLSSNDSAELSIIVSKIVKNSVLENNANVCPKNESFYEKAKSSMFFCGDDGLPLSTIKYCQVHVNDLKSISNGNTTYLGKIEEGLEMSRVKHDFIRAIKTPIRATKRFQEKGVIDSRSLWRPDKKIFKKKSKKLSLDTACYLLVDGSASMITSNMLPRAFYLADEILNIMDLATIPTECVVFSCRTTYRDYAYVDDVIYKKFSEPYTKNNAFNSGFIYDQYHVENVDHVSIMHAVKKLWLRKEKNKLLIVISDGNPQVDNYSEEVLSEALKQTIKYIERSGVNALGIGIETDEIKNFYKNFLVYNERQEFELEFIKKLTTEMTNHRRN